MGEGVALRVGRLNSSPSVGGAQIGEAGRGLLREGSPRGVDDEHRMSPKYEWSIVLLTATQTHTQLARKMAIADEGQSSFGGCSDMISISFTRISVVSSPQSTSRTNLASTFRCTWWSLCECADG